jgi:hypothetical protein
MNLRTKLWVLAGGALLAAGVVTLAVDDPGGADPERPGAGRRGVLGAVLDECFDDGVANDRCSFTDPEPFRHTEAFKVRGSYQADGDLELKLRHAVPLGNYYGECHGRGDTAVIAVVRVRLGQEPRATAVFGHNRPAQGERRVACTFYEREVLR